MTNKKRRIQLREAKKRARAKKKAAGYVYFSSQIKPEWRKQITDLINKLKEI